MRLAVVLLFVAFVICNDDYVRVPGGLMMHKDCVREIPSGSIIEDLGDDGVILNGQKLEACAHKPIFNGARKSENSKPGSLPADGWQTWTVYQHPQNTTFSTFNGNFSVPDAPVAWSKIDSAIVYIVSKKTRK